MQSGYKYVSLKLNNHHWIIQYSDLSINIIIDININIFININIKIYINDNTGHTEQHNISRGGV